MNLKFIIITDLVLLAFLIGSIWYFADTVLNSRQYRIGYVSSNIKQVAPVLKALTEHYIKDTTTVNFIEPGSGLGHISRYLSKTFLYKEIINIDASLVLISLNYLLNLFQPSKSPVTFIWSNIFLFTYPNNSFIYCYLSVPIMQRLYAEGKFQGCLIASLSFHIPEVAATEVIPIPGWQKKMYVYDFRTPAK